MDLTLEKVSPFLPTVKESQKPRVTAWLTAIQAALNGRYGASITPDREPLFVGFAADAVLRRLERPNGSVLQQSIGPASVRYADQSTLGGWFLPGEVASMDETSGIGGVRSHRTPAPDGIRYGNLTGGEVVEEV